ncbi:MAG: hypothetical protein LBP55_04605 [Candidatus Adiutrix sp.]|jgi:hypothetical protein|nr:hypothetical protein [Candidatus Adiutrix sp.]
MIKRFTPIILLAVILGLGLAGCAGEPATYSSRKVNICKNPTSKLRQVPYTREDKSDCAVAIAPFDVSVWNEAPLNSHKTRSVPTVDLGCLPLSPATDNCSTCGLPGHANTLMLNFDPSVYPEDMKFRRAVLAVYSPNNPQGLNGVVLRGRLNVGDELQSLANYRETVVKTQTTATAGWVFFDVSKFVARAINERRNSISFELSVPCQTPATNLVTVGVSKNEPNLVVEFN